MRSPIRNFCFWFCLRFNFERTEGLLFIWTCSFHSLLMIFMKRVQILKLSFFFLQITSSHQPSLHTSINNLSFLITHKLSKPSHFLSIVSKRNINLKIILRHKSLNTSQRFEFWFWRFRLSFWENFKFNYRFELIV